MRQGEWLPSLTLAFVAALVLAAPLRAQTPAPHANPPPVQTAPSPAPGPTQAPPPGPPPGALLPSAPVPNAEEPDEGVPGIPSGSTAETISIPSRTTAMLTARAKWDDGFASIKDSLAKIKAAMDAAGLKPAGSPFAVFTQTDDNGFAYEAMVPILAKPPGKDALSPDVTFGSSPSGEAIKFQHRGPYDDIDSTYDLITAYLDEKDLEARDFFIEEYLTELTTPEDPNLAVDIYVFIK